MIFKSKCKTLSDYIQPVVIADNALEHVSYVKFLGVIIDDKLNWKNHMSYVSSKAAEHAGILPRVIDILSRKKIVDLYYNMIYPFISWVNIAWASTYNTSLYSIFQLQNKFVRIVTYSSWNAQQVLLITYSSMWMQYVTV